MPCPFILTVLFSFKALWNTSLHLIFRNLLIPPSPRCHEILYLGYSISVFPLFFLSTCSQLELHIRITWGTFKKHWGLTPTPDLSLFRILGKGAQILFSVLFVCLLCFQVLQGTLSISLTSCPITLPCVVLLVPSSWNSGSLNPLFDHPLALKTPFSMNTQSLSYLPSSFFFWVFYHFSFPKFIHCL